MHSNSMTVHKMRHFLLMMTTLLALAGLGYCELTSPSKVESSYRTASSTPFTKLFSEPFMSTVASTATSSMEYGFKKAKEYTVTESSSTTYHSTTKVYTSTMGVRQSATKQNLNTSSSALRAGVHSPVQLQERLRALDCDLAVLPRESRLWRGNETHELNLPVTMAEECAGSGSGGATPGAAEEECPPVIVSWEGSADLHSGDILIVRIADSLLFDTLSHSAVKNSTTAYIPRTDGARIHRTLSQPAVYQVTRKGHEHCDISDGVLMEITLLNENGAKIFTLYEKDLIEGVNLFIVVSENWQSQCVRLEITMKSDNCGESQDCSGKGVCYTNVSMEEYECQCCPGFAGPYCEQLDVCNPSPCLNNGTCVDLPQPLNGVNYRCRCPHGYTGRNCETDSCSSSPCMNAGSCMSTAMNGTATFLCACTDGWTGAQCDLPISRGACASNPCVKGICVEQTDANKKGEDYRCFCEPGYTGLRCELEYNECESSPCANGGTCTDRVGSFECFCGRGYNGNTCQHKVDLCNPNPCPSHRFCVDRGNNYACECPRGYVGEECHLPVTSACDNNPCAHGGTCWSGIDSFSCSCRPGFTGKLCEEDFILESVVGSEVGIDMNSRDRGRSENIGGGSVREVRMPLGLYHDRLHNVYIAAGTLGAAIAIVGVVVTACHCRVNKTYSRLLSRLSRSAEPGPPHHWLQDKRAPPIAAPFPPPSAALDTTDMYYTLDFSDSQSSPLIQ